MSQIPPSQYPYQPQQPDPQYPQQPYPPGQYAPGQFPPQSPYQMPYQGYQPPTSGGGKATASMVLGIISLIAWCLPILGLPIAIVGLVLGNKDKNGPNPGAAKAGIIMCTIGLILALINAAVGAYLGMTGQHPLVSP